MNHLARIDRLAARRPGTPPAVELEVPEVPDIITFVTSPDYLNRPRLYPRQALLLKIMFLELDLLTAHDYQVLARWGSGFTPTGEPGSRRLEGTEGAPPDLLARMAACRAQGRRWFRETVLVMGRRASKGHVSALAAAYVVWNYLATGNPQKHYGIDRSKTITGMFFAGEKSQASDNLFRDLARFVEEAPCFAPYLASSTRHALRICTPHDLASSGRPARDMAADASIVVDARPSTGLAGRGPAGFMALFDEVAHLGVDTARSADSVYDAAVPALDQFGLDGFILQASSPASQLGKFHSSYQAGLALNDDGTAKDPTMLVVQLPSWAPYEGWEATAEPGGLEMWPGGPTFAPLDKPLVVYDDAMRAAERANPKVFAVERRAQWRTSMDAFLDPDLVKSIFGPYRGAPLAMRTSGALGTEYVIHVDPAKNRANYAIVVAHADPPDDKGLRHVVVDAIHVRRPADYPDGRINLVECHELIKGLIAVFAPVSVTFDQYDSALGIEILDLWCQQRRLPRSPWVHERPASAPHNRRLADIFETAARLGLVHVPEQDLARRELLHLQERNGRVDHPTYGPVKTSDIADALFEVTEQLIGGELDRWSELGSVPLGMSQAGGLPASFGTPPRPMSEELNWPAPSPGLASVRWQRDGKGMPARGRHWRNPRG